MRTTIDLPDDLYRSLKTRAAARGVTLRELIVELIERGSQASQAVETVDTAKEPPLPVAIPATGATFSALTNAELHKLEADDYLKKLERSS